MKNTKNTFFGAISNFTRKIFGTFSEENSISSFMTAMINEQNDAYEREFASFNSDYLYN